MAPGWIRGPDEYRRAARVSDAQTRLPAGRAARAADDRLAVTGITWSSTALDFTPIEQSFVARVRSRYRARLPEFVWDAAALEGNPFTLPEVRTLLDGVTVAGHKLDDQEQILALNEGHNLVDDLVGRDHFTLDKATSDRVHALVAKHEALESGAFRGEGPGGGGGLVSLGSAGQYQASEPGEHGAALIRENQDLLDYLAIVSDPRERALAYFCAATYRQFYFDGNKRTARLMMTGVLLADGFDAISISANRRLEYNTYLTEMFVERDATALMRFIVDCRSADLYPGRARNHAPPM